MRRMSLRLHYLSLVSVFLLTSAPWTPAVAKTKGCKRTFIKSFVQLVKNPARAIETYKRRDLAKKLRAWRAHGQKVIKLGEGCYQTYAKPKRVEVPGGDYKGWLKGLGGQGAFEAYLGGAFVRPRDVENASWKLKAVVPIDSRYRYIKYDVPSAMSIGYDPSRAQPVEGKKWVFYHADLRFSGKEGARERVSTNLHLKDLGGDIQRQKKVHYTDLGFDLPKSKIHSQDPYSRVTLQAKLLNPNVIIATMGHISGNQNTDQIAVYERQPRK